VSEQEGLFKEEARVEKPEIQRDLDRLNRLIAELNRSVRRVSSCEMDLQEAERNCRMPYIVDSFRKVLAMRKHEEGQIRRDVAETRQRLRRSWAK
jgi:hypothetical protein